jgi:hypothetical protein
VRLFIRAKQSLTCLNNPNNTCVCCHYEPFNKRSFLGGEAHVATIRFYQIVAVHSGVG